MTECYSFMNNTLSYIGGNNIMQPISEAELDIMRIVWANQGSTFFSYIMRELETKEKTWQKNTVITLLARLMDKGYLKAKKTGRRNEYTPLVSEADYQSLQTRNFIEKIYEGSVGGLISNLIRGDLLKEDEYESLRNLLERGEKNE